MAQGPEPSYASVELTRALGELAQLAWRGVPGCDGASVSLLHDGEPSTLASSHDRVRALDQAQYTRDHGPCISAMRNEDRVVVDDYTHEHRWPELADELADAGVRSSLSLPIGDGQHVLGGLNLYANTIAAFTEASEHAADSFAQQAVMLLRTLQQQHTERAVHAHDRQVATTLQRALLPTVPGLPGITSAARYLTAGAAAEVGGDWYDVMALPDGSIGVAIGDVMGHDVLAAAAMGQLRSVLRSYAYEGSTTATVLDRLDRLVQAFDMAQAATALYGRLTLTDDGAVLAFTNAGHPPPLLRHPDGTVTQITTGRNVLIGALPPTDSRREGAVHLTPGATLILYTDGLVETREQDISDGIQTLVNTTAALPLDATPAEVCDTLTTQHVTQNPTDDIALLVIRINPQRTP